MSGESTSRSNRIGPFVVAASIAALTVVRHASAQATAGMPKSYTIEEAVAQVSVQRGAAQGDLAEVFGGLHEGDVVARRGSEDLRNGVSVQVRAALPPGSK